MFIQLLFFLMYGCGDTNFRSCHLERRIKLYDIIMKRNHTESSEFLESWYININIYADKEDIAIRKNNTLVMHMK